MKLRHFGVQLTIRLTFLFLGLLLLAFGVAAGMRPLLLFGLAAVNVIQAAALVRFINYTNSELESFLSALKFGDFQQAYTIAHLGPSFRALEKTLDDTVRKFKRLRTEKEKQAIYNRTVIQHIPVPLFVVYGEGRIRVLNNATRRVFNVADITNIRETAQFGASFQRDILQVRPGEALLTTIEFAGTQEHFIMTATQLTTGGESHKLISLQNVQNQIDATELATWQNMLRVTSHEILNSLAPVSSCAQTAKSLVDEVIENSTGDEDSVQDLLDIQESLDTVLRRSEGLTRFVQNYRQLSRLPPPNKTTILLSDYFQSLKTLVQDELARKNIRLEINCLPGGLSLTADKDMLDQVCINLIRNASDALADSPEARIAVTGYSDSKHRTVVEVSDNGPGIPAELADQIFMPFFTTKSQGSGIGLALVRYIMLSHGGTVTYFPGPEGGSSFRLVF